MNVRLIWITPEAEKLIGYIARVSNPKNQDNPNIAKLLTYCIEHKHWSPFEMASMCVEIETSMAIGEQILRHRSFSFQKFSGRYSDISELGFEPIELRQQSEKNRQSSTDRIDPVLWEDVFGGDLASDAVRFHLEMARDLYKQLLEKGVAKECARMVLPAATTTRLYMSGTLRSWIHYLQLRCAEDVQKEHRDVACRIRDGIFVPLLPTISEALGWA